MTRHPSPPGLCLPLSRREMDQRGWTQCDIILVTGDAYIDHPSFGAALIGRWLESQGYRVGIIAAPEANDVESFRALGPPRLFWGITAGNLDSQLSRLTVMRKRRRDDPYLPEDWSERRPPNATIVYVTKARQAFKEMGRNSEGSSRTIPVIIGGIEASLRRFPYYDYWTDKVKRSLLFDSKADLLVYGMAEQAIAEVARRLERGEGLSGIPGTAEVTGRLPDSVRSQPNLNPSRRTLPSFETVSTDKEAFNEMTREILINAACDQPVTLIQAQGDRQLVVYPPVPPLASSTLDALYTLPFTRRPHPVYGTSRIAAYEMIKDSITTHRGCYGSCAFCAIATHQGKTITSRSRNGILSEIRILAATPGFPGTISDLGGPTANMYGTYCRIHGAHCKRPGCLTPTLCPNLETNATPQLELLRSARTMPGVNHVFVTSGLRFDLALAQDSCGYIAALAAHHVSGRLKIAPEHISNAVLRVMRKPGTADYRRFVKRFTEESRQANKPQQIVEYFISGHPGCTLADMIELAQVLKREGIRPEQVQDFYPAPLTLAAAMFHTGRDALTGETVFVAKTDNDKALQRALLLYHDPAHHRKAREALRAAGREDLIGNGSKCLVPAGP
jgi:uncharacterized radical SAM protein YgiQ